VTKPITVPYSYLDAQFAQPEPALAGMRELVARGDFTLGWELEEFERRFAALCGLPHAVGVSSGTDALALCLVAAGIGHGDEVITTPDTFIATVGAINQVGAKIVFVDCADDYNIDPALIERAITRRTKAILAVHLTGNPADMLPIQKIARRRKLIVVEDACQAIGAAIDGRPVGSFGIAAGFSLHPLKNLNVWGDAGVVVTTSARIAAKIRLLRNHGMRTRDEIAVLGFNHRMDTLQAVVGNWLIGDTKDVTEQRIANAARYDRALSAVPQITLPPRRPGFRQVYHTYVVQAERRDLLYRYLLEQGIDAKIHYPVPLHLQPGLRHLGYQRGRFPVTERQARRILSLPVHQHLTDQQLDYVVQTVGRFYAGKT
jgi:dTDP-3-amino-2,3,6-trideoxy-4-keto-D-glucose/dTDP-3-amino-3,4,6-trideoxy-alpha-D-glucose/dTDP-2,6-dideoxy-D-kanosamine transaminase